MGVVTDKLDYLSGTKRLLREAINAILADRGDPLLTESDPFENYPSALWASSPAPSAGSLTGSAADKLLRLNETKSRLREAINAELGIGLTESDPFREFAAKFHPVLSLYQNGEQGAWYDPSDLTTLYQDSAGTTPVTVDGDPVGLMLDKSGNGNHASQSVAASRPIYRTDGTLRWLEFDGVDDRLNVPNVITSGNFSLFAAVRSDDLSQDGRYFVQGSIFPDSSRIMLYSTRTASNAKAITVLDSVTYFDTPTLDTDMHIYGTRRSSSGELKTQVDAGAITTRSGVPTSVPSPSATLGYGASSFDGGIAGMVLQGEVYADDARTSEVIKYLATKAGVTL